MSLVALHWCTSALAWRHANGQRRILSALRPYRGRLILLVVLAALAGAAVGELAPRGGTTSTKTQTAVTHPESTTGNLGMH